MLRSEFQGLLSLLATLDKQQPALPFYRRYLVVVQQRIRQLIHQQREKYL